MSAKRRLEGMNPLSPDRWTRHPNPDNSFYSLAIGFTVAAGAIAVGPISGGAFNPAVVFGGAAMGMFAGSTLWVYLVAQIAAAVAAGLTFRAINADAE